MAEGDKSARLWFYSRDLDFSASLSGYAKKGAKVGGPTALKHWAVVLDYMSTKNPDRVNKRILYEANNEKGLLVAGATQHAEDEEEEWEQRPGFQKKDLGMVTINENRAQSYCDEFNRRQIKYVATKDNCQRFVDEFLANLLPDSEICLPVNAEAATSWFSSMSSASLNSVSNSISS